MYWQRITSEAVQKRTRNLHQQEKKLNTRLPKRALTNIDIMNFSYDIPFFRGVFMRDELPHKPYQIECGVVNLDSSKNSGTHWVAYGKINDYIEYFDSYGNLKPPKELIDYIGSNLYFNNDNLQRNNLYNCGHLC